MSTPTEAIKAFLDAYTHPDLAALYSFEMEVQVNVAQDDGQYIKNEFKGRIWHGYTDGVQTWKSLRIPWNAAVKPNYDETNRKMKFDLAVHAEGIGMTGWNWKQGVSQWIAYDFDSIIGHSDKHTSKLSAEELQQVQDAAFNIPWVTVRQSTGGSGLHLYVFLNDVPTQNHTEHAALGRAILSKMSAEAGFDFTSKVDACGQNMWIWHRKMKGIGLKLLKQGSVLNDIPINWKDHLSVIKGTRRKNLPQFVDDVSLFEQITSQRAIIKLDDGHKKLLDYLKKDGEQSSWWDTDHSMLVTHTSDLKKAHKELGLRGIFDTVATGKDTPDHNCLSGETEILTSKGSRLIKDVAAEGGAYLYVYNGKEYIWLWCEVKSFGTQETVPIKFGNYSKVRATLNHDWLWYNHENYKIDLKKKKKTYELNKKEHLPLAEIKLPEIDWRGYAHGFVYGDGHFVNNRGKCSCEIKLFKRDQDLTKLLAQYGNVGSSKVKGHGYIPHITQLPDDWKHLSENPTKEYALGFVLGLINADASIDKRHGGIVIYQADYHALKEIRRLALYAGLRARQVRLSSIERIHEYDNKQINGQELWALTIESYNLTENHFLRQDHKKNFKKKQHKHILTTVKNIDFDNKIKEEVFCAVVPSYHNFTLANGVVTGNCFGFAQSNGSWIFRRYTLGTQESANWNIDVSGYTKSVYNQDPDLKTTARTYDGIEDEKGVYHFSEAETAATATSFLGTNLNIPNWACSRPTQIKQHKDGRLLVSIKKEDRDNINDMRGWREEKGYWKRIFDCRITKQESSEISNFDNIIRHLSNQEGNDYGWVLKSGSKWHTEPLVHIRAALKTLGLSNREIDLAIGKCIIESWSIVNEPFEDEYPGNRKWNRNAAQFCFIPSQKEPFNCPTWNKILKHVGSGLNDAVKNNGWCQANGVITGADYLRIWIASLFQRPKEPLPYLFFYSKEECTGKSTFHEALCILITKSGYARADAALLSQQAFNAELENAVLCIIQESDLRKGAQVRNRLKDWVTSPEIAIHTKGKTPYLARNTTHYVHTANNYEECPIFSGDTRITMSYVKPIDPLEMIPRKQLYKQLEQEAPDFMAVILGIEIPPCVDRLNIPVVDTADKIQTGKMNRTSLEVFLDEVTFYVSGHKILYSDVWNRFQEFLPPEEVHLWSKIKLGRELPRCYPKGRCMAEAGKFYVGNISWTKEDSNAEPLKLNGEALE